MKTYGLQFDSTDRLPFTPDLQLFYANGRFASPLIYRRGRVYIDVNGSAPTKAMWLDVERFDASPADAPRFLDERRAAGLSHGGIYCDRSSLAEVEAECGNRPHWLTVATLDGTANITPVPGVGVLAAIQLYPASMVGASFNADISAVVDPDYWKAHAIGAG